MFYLLFKVIGVAHADEKERAVIESGQGKVQKHQHNQPQRYHSLTRYSC